MRNPSQKSHLLDLDWVLTRDRRAETRKWAKLIAFPTLAESEIFNRPTSVNSIYKSQTSKNQEIIQSGPQ